MKKISAIIAVLAVAVVFAFVGCQKQEAPKPAEQSTMTPTTPASAPMPAATPGVK
jgi:PBP1b-binding outer membrane lipoprotein LpoB